jgi:hypothetical protein
MEFEVGDTVEWVSESRETSLHKKGKIAYKILPGSLPPLNDMVLKNLPTAPLRQRIKTSKNPRTETSYVVIVQQTNPTRRRAYWPDAKKLKLAEE